MYRTVRSRTRVRPGELEPTQTPAATQHAGDATARAARAGDVTATDLVRFRTMQGSWRVAQMAQLLPASASPDEAQVRAVLRAIRSDLAASQCEIARLASEQQDGHTAASVMQQCLWQLVLGRDMGPSSTHAGVGVPAVRLCGMHCELHLT